METEQPFPRPISRRPVTDPPSGLVPARTVLTDRRVRWKPLDPAVHATDLYRASHASDEARRIWEYLPTGPWPDQAGFSSWRSGQAAAFDPIRYALHRAEGGPACGTAGYLGIRPLDGVIKIGGIWVAPDMQWTRAATEALYLLLAYTTDDLRYRRMQWRCNAADAKSRHAASRLGFRFKGIFYNHMITKGQNRDTAWYSILDDEWPEVRNTIQCWLDDDNFDSAGTARRSLPELMQHRSAP